METGKKNVPEIEIQGVTKSYETREGSFLALEEVNLDVEKNEFICVVGPSGQQDRFQRRILFQEGEGLLGLLRQSPFESELLSPGLL